MPTARLHLRVEVHLFLLQRRGDGSSELVGVRGPWHGEAAGVRGVELDIPLLEVVHVDLQRER